MLLERGIAKADSVYPSVCHTPEQWLHGSRHRNAFFRNAVSRVVVVPTCILWHADVDFGAAAATTVLHCQ